VRLFPGLENFRKLAVSNSEKRLSDWHVGTRRHMLLKLNQILFLGFLCAVVMHVSCSAKKPITSSYAPFRLESLNNDSLLLTPPIPEGHANNAAIKMTLIGNTTPPSVTNCFAERGPFRLEQGRNDPHSIQITLPAPETWLTDLEGSAEPRASEDIEALYAILADLDQLQQEGCFGETNSSIRDFILQSLPMTPNESLFNTYGYLEGRTSMDLKPGMRLKIERAYFRPAKAGNEEHDAKTFLGVSTMYLDVEVAGNSKIRFRRVGSIRYSPASLAHRVQEENRDLGLILIPRQLHYRLLFYTYLVPKKHTRFPAIIGAGNASQLDELDRELRAQSDESCKNVATARRVTCVEFDGSVAVSALIKVELNGKPRFLEWGAKIKDVLSKSSEVEALKTLRFQRRFMNSYYDVRFDPEDSNVLSLALVGGDRLTWSKSSSAPQ